MQMTLSYKEWKQQIIEALRRAATAQESGRISEVDDLYDSIDAELPRDGGPEFDKLLIALEFWAGWIDSRNHDWKFYEGIGGSDWPKLARQISDDLQSDRETEDERIRKHFDYRFREEVPGIWQRLRRYLSMKKQ
jgi:hypothetical protein